MRPLNIWDFLLGVTNAVAALIGAAAALFGLLILAVAVWCTWRIWTGSRDALEKDQDWPRATGTLVGGRSLDLGELGAVSGSSYSFTVDGASYTGTDWEKVVRYPLPGEPIQVMYNPDDPSDNHPAGKIARRVGSWALMFGVLTALLYLCALGMIYMSVGGLVALARGA